MCRIIITLETIGYFHNFFIFIQSLQRYFGLQFELSQHQFNTLLDTYPELLLDNLLNILICLKEKQLTCQSFHCILTSTRSYDWHFVHCLMNYFNYKLKHRLFSVYLPFNAIARSENAFYITTEPRFLTNYNCNARYIVLDPYLYCVSINSMISRIKTTCLMRLLHEPYLLFEIKMTREMKKYSYFYVKNNYQMVNKSIKNADCLLKTLSYCI